MEESFNLEDFNTGENKDSNANNLTSPKDTAEPTLVKSRGRNNPNQGVKFKQWAEISPGTYTGIGKISKILPPALYRIAMDDRGNYYFEIQPIKTDELLRFSDSLADEILSEIDRFWELKKQFEINKFSHRRGYLLYGPQGSGKSIIVQQIIEGIIHRNGIAIWVDKNPKMITTAIVEALRIVEPTRPIVVIFEDIDAIIQDYGESAILSYLDGDGRIDGVLNLATTNYPEKLDKRVVARPRRFDRVVKVDVPSPSIRKEYFKYKVKDLTEEQLEQWTTSTAGFSFAALADLIISVKCFEYKFEDAAERLRKLLDSNPSSEEFKTRKTGFNAH